MNTLGLNVIVGAGEAPLLERCMNSFCGGKFFDEIVIVNTSGDESVNVEARKYTDKILYHQWATREYPNGNFAAARNAALDATTTDYVWWQDVDDVYWPEASEKSLQHVKSVICDPKNAVDVHFVPYVVAIDPQCQPVVVFNKDRIFRRGATRWSRPVHEQLFKSFDGVDKAFLNGIQSVHLPAKSQSESAERNVAILEHEIANGRGDDITRFFLARDMMLCSRIEEGVRLFEQLFAEMNLDFPSLFAIAIELCYYYGYGKLRLSPKVGDLNAGLDTERWLRLALALSFDFAEPYLMLGDLYQQRNKLGVAESLYNAALRKKPGKGHGLQLIPYYRELPATRLAEMYERIKKYDKALWFNKVALEAGCKEPAQIDLRLRMLDILKEETEAMRGSICSN